MEFVFTNIYWLYYLICFQKFICTICLKHFLWFKNKNFDKSKTKLGKKNNHNMNTALSTTNKVNIKMTFYFFFFHLFYTLLFWAVRGINGFLFSCDYFLHSFFLFLLFFSHVIINIAHEYTYCRARFPKRISIILFYFIVQIKKWC